ncbi:progestin and adipoQ receptor family member VII, a [Myxocyprinus asiaticus]|uniref:progestin and adipoQ receptor family member VII, a n=1 Tax=Myxocyprinus asiaticus TaxID=70543 RepID=UPI00222313BE|nr:progestin and adipoQ receptor family member VII, a [Myxocyprinus asiaticus]XP_051527922.1 progestin and adipoQ receptor family member VII, a [Myxocyprinus asiaticus]
MATIVMEKIGRLFINLQQVRRVPQMLTDTLPSMPGTLRDTEVPCFFRERYIHSGYRPLHQNWRYYLLSLLRRHNETINVWTHLVGALVMLIRTAQLTETVDFISDPHSWALLILLLSSTGYLTFSAIAHLLASKSELCHYSFFFLDYVGVAMYQYGSAVVHYYYAIEESWHACVQGCFMPIAGLLCCLSCFGCCYGKYRNYSLPPWVRKVGQVLPSALAYGWDTSPVFHRLGLWFLSWVRGDSRDIPALTFHFGQVAFFLSSAFFFTQPFPERWFPGHCDFLGQGHQVFHVLLVLCTLCQIHASYLDYLNRRHLYVHLHSGGEALFFVVLYILTVVTCALIALYMLGKVKRLLGCREKMK